MSPQAFFPIVLLGFLFGSTLVVSRFSVGQFQPSTYISLRLLLASLAHVTIYLGSRNRKWPVGGYLWGHATVLSIFGTVIPMNALVASLQFQSSGLTAILITTGPAITVLMAHFFLVDESLTLRKAVGVGLALGGALLLALSGESGLPDVSRANPLGYILVLLAMISGSASTIYARRSMRDLDTIDVASIRMWVAAMIVTPLSLLLVGFDLSQVTRLGFSALLYAALIGTFMGMMLAFYNIKRFGATASAISGYFIPIASTIGGVLFLDETITLTMIVGMIVIITGIALLNRGIRLAAASGSPLVP